MKSMKKTILSQVAVTQKTPGQPSLPGGRRGPGAGPFLALSLLLLCRKEAMRALYFLSGYGPVFLLGPLWKRNEVIDMQTRSLVKLSGR